MRTSDEGLTRRQALRDIGAAGLGLAAAGAGIDALLARLYATPRELAAKAARAIQN